ncbi:FmdB family transcriptional regulator [bacterium B17]|nr:FmdB family transcriptional regulator [bacterium B17]
MPTYDYECTKCGHRFEKFQSMSDEPVKRCPECRCKVKRLIGTGAGVIFKGSGFYQTDYRSDSYRKAEKKDKESAKPSKSSSKDKKTGAKAKSSGVTGKKK